jgi:hypothetical protein
VIGQNFRGPSISVEHHLYYLPTSISDHHQRLQRLSLHLNKMIYRRLASDVAGNFDHSGVAL